MYENLSAQKVTSGFNDRLYKILLLKIPKENMKAGRF
jgi:hypothetical protein